MKSLPKVAALSVALAMPGLAVAADGEGLFAVKGAGSVSCGELLGALDGNNQRGLLLYGWIEGYLTAANQNVDGVFDHTPWQRVELLAELLLSHCESNQEQAVFRAMGLMLQAMSPTALRVKSEVEIIDAGAGQAFEIYRSTLKAVQERLVTLGHLSGGADGRYGPKTAAAIGAFQQEAELQINNLPDQATLLALFAEQFNGR